MQKAPKSLWNANYLFLILVNFFVSISYSMVAMVISQYAVSMGMSVALAGSPNRRVFHCLHGCTPLYRIYQRSL